jgi:hypothetical protein
VPTHSDIADAARAVGDAYADAILAHQTLSDRHGRADGRGRAVMTPLLAESRERLEYARDAFFAACNDLVDAGREAEAGRIAAAVLDRTGGVAAGRATVEAIAC